MPELKGLLFAPGIPDEGKAAQFEVSADGLRLIAPQMLGGGPLWRNVTAQKSGWDGAQLRLEWPGQAGACILMVSDAVAVRAVTAAAGKAVIKPARTVAAIRAWSVAVIAAVIVIPLLLLATVLWQHEAIASWMVGFISVEQEQKLGAQLFEGQKARLKPIAGAPQQMVSEIGARLTKGSPYRYEFYVTDDKTVNAYAMPGGYIVVHSGLLRLATSADEVAGVLAHEAAHVEKRHSLNAMAKSMGLSAALALAFGDFGSAASVAGDLLNLKFSRDHEREADSEGLKKLVAAGVRPEAMAAFFRKMAAQEKINLGFLSTHPASEERFAAIEAAIGALPAAARAAPALNYDYAAIVAGLPK